MLKAHNVLIISAKDFGISIAVSMELQAFSSVYLLFVFFFFLLQVHVSQMFIFDVGWPFIYLFSLGLIPLLRFGCECANHGM